MNLGMEEKEGKTFHGFPIRRQYREWTKDSQAPSDAEDDDVRNGSTTQRITPYVEDVRNILVVTPMRILLRISHCDSSARPEAGNRTGVPDRRV
jgi:hypothetical protein